MAALARWTVLAALAALIAAHAPGALAQEGNAFVARGVMVDVTADSAAQAKERGLAEAQVRAFRQMLEKVTAAEDHSRLPELEPGRIANMIAGFDIESEKSSNVRYIATLTYRFDPEAVRRLLQDYRIPYAEARGTPTVVVPVLRDADGLRLWEEPNPWRQVWTDLAGRAGLIPVVVPLGDLVDISSVTPEQALAGDVDALQELARRYGAADALVAAAEPREAAIDVRALHVRKDGSSELLDRTITKADVRDPEFLWAAAADAVLGSLEEEWKNNNLIHADQRDTIEVVVPVQNLSDWVLVRRRLDGLGQVETARLTHLRRGEARVRIDYFGPLEQLHEVLGRSGLVLTPRPGPWILAPRGAPGAAPALGEEEPLMAPATGNGGTIQ